MKSRPQTLLASRIGEWFNFVSQGTAKAISADLDTDETTTIAAIYPGQHLQFFTSSAEFYAPVEPITPPPAIKRTTRRGIAPGTPLAEISGATLFVTAGGTALGEFLFDDNRSTYAAPFLSKFATHLLAGTAEAPTSIVDMGFRRAANPKDCDRALLIRGDGDLACMHALREDEVTGFTRWTTQGLFLAADADLARDEYIAVQRTVDGSPEILLEKVERSALLDAQVVVDGPGSGAVTDLWHLEGQTVVMMIDGQDAGDHVVTGGEVLRPYAALRETAIGLLFVPRLVTLPPVLEGDPRAGRSIVERLGVVDIEFGPSANVKIGLKDGALYRPQAMRPGPNGEPFEGWAQVIGLTGFRSDAQCEIVQARPGPLQIKQIALTIES